MSDWVSNANIIFQKIEFPDGKRSLNAIYKTNGNVTGHLPLPFTIIHVDVEQIIHAHFQPFAKGFDLT